jgi:hypothetical protein
MRGQMGVRDPPEIKVGLIAAVGVGGIGATDLPVRAGDAWPSGGCARGASALPWLRDRTRREGS